MEGLFIGIAIFVLIIIILLVYHLVSSGDWRYGIFLVIFIPLFVWLGWQGYKAGDERRRLADAKKFHVIKGNVLEQSAIDIAPEGRVPLPPLPPIGYEERSVTIRTEPEDQELLEIREDIRLAK